MMWHVVFAERGGLPQSRAARSRNSAIRVACELLSQSCDVRRVMNRTARSLNGRSWTSISTAAGFQASVDILLPFASLISRLVKSKIRMPSCRATQSPR